MYKRKVVIREDRNNLNLVKRTAERDYNDIKDPIFLIDAVIDELNSSVIVSAYGEDYTKDRVDEYLDWIYENYNKEE